MKERLIAILETALIALFFFSLVQLIQIGLTYKAGNDVYKETQETFVKTDSEIYEDIGIDFDIDFEPLLEKNSEVVGWIYIPDTVINYPLVWHEDNQYYTEHTYEKKALKCGAIFLDARCNSDFTSDNTIIHGHNMKNKSMFGDLKKYGDLDYLNEHPYIYIITEEYCAKYEIFSATYTKVGSYVYQIDIGDSDAKTKWAKRLAVDSQPETNIRDFTGIDAYITLSTCTSTTDEGRFIVTAMHIETIYKEE